jgi:hypothetical protein
MNGMKFSYAGRSISIFPGNSVRVPSLLTTRRMTFHTCCKYFGLPFLTPLAPVRPRTSIEILPHLVPSDHTRKVVNISGKICRAANIFYGPVPARGCFSKLPFAICCNRKRAA